MTPVEPGKHIVHLKKHRNALYLVVLVLITLQILSFVTLSSQISLLHAEQSFVKESLQQSLDDARQRNQASINEISKEVSQQKNELNRNLAQQESSFQKQLDTIKASGQDFSEVIEKTIRGVVSIGTDKASATGFVVSSDGYIITNDHVIAGNQYIKVLTYDGQLYDASLIGRDQINDIAVLKVTPSKSLDYVEMADSNDVQVGQKVIAIGNPLGLSFTVTEGIVSSTKRKGPNGLEEYIQTDVTLNPGNSGGPLINSQGKVIGINNFKVGGAEGLGFALQSNSIIDVVNRITSSTMLSHEN
jgi:S1-C subfamily serine protease